VLPVWNKGVNKNKIRFEMLRKTLNKDSKIRFFKTAQQTQNRSKLPRMFQDDFVQVGTHLASLCQQMVWVLI